MGYLFALVLCPMPLPYLLGCILAPHFLGLPSWALLLLWLFWCPIFILVSLNAVCGNPDPVGHDYSGLPRYEAGDPAVLVRLGV